MQDLEKRLSEYLDLWESGRFQLGPDLSVASTLTVVSTADDLPEHDRILLSKQLKGHAKLLRICEAKGLDGTSSNELDEGQAESHFATLGGLILYAFEHGVIDENEMQKYRKCNIRGNSVKHQVCRHQHVYHGDLASNVSVPDISLADTTALPQHDPVIRMVRHHRRLVEKLSSRGIVAGMTASQQKKVLHIFSKTIALAVEKEVVGEKEAEKLRGIRDKGNQAKHEEVRYYARLDQEYNKRLTGADE